MWKGREKLQRFEHLKNKKSFLDAIKNIIIVFEGLSFGEKIKNRLILVDWVFFYHQQPNLHRILCQLQNMLIGLSIPAKA